jgi:hypothetical protein
MVFRRFVLCILVCATLSTGVSAQTPERVEKRAAIRQLLNLIGATQSAKAIFVSLIDQYSQALAQDSVKSFESKPWPPEFKEKSKQLTLDFYSRLSQRLREELPQRIQYDAKVGEIYLDAYDRYFTEEDIRELLAFYSSPVGKKFVGLASQVAAEMRTVASAELGSQVMSVTREIVAEELKGLESRADAELKATKSPRKG